MKNLFALACVLGLAVGCSSDGDDDVLLRDATLEDAQDFCEYVNDHRFEPTTCTVDGVEYEVEPSEPQDCSNIDIEEEQAPATCNATIGDAKDCVDALEEDPCLLVEDDLPAACDYLFSAECGGE